MAQFVASSLGKFIKIFNRYALDALIVLLGIGPTICLNSPYKGDSVAF